MDKGTHVSAAHIPGQQNILADTASRKIHKASEWILSKNIFNHLIACFSMPQIDLFAYRLDNQLHRYASWMCFSFYELGKSICIIIPSIQHDMACSEQNIIGIDKRSSNSSNVSNSIMVQQIIRTSSRAANDYLKQISATPRYRSKTSSLSQTETAQSDMHSRSAQTSTVQKETINVLNAAWRDGDIFRR